MVWTRVKALLKDALDSPDTGAVFSTLSALSAEGVPVSPQVDLKSYRPYNRALINYGIEVRDARSLRSGTVNFGWIWLAGTTEQGSFCLPAAYAPVRATDSDFTFTGDIQVSQRVADIGVRLDLLRRVTEELQFGRRELLAYGGLKAPSTWTTDEQVERWARDFGEAIGLEVQDVAYDSPIDHIAKEGITAHLGVGLFESRTSERGKRIYDLEDLDNVPSLKGTAFDVLYGSEYGDADAPERELYAFRPLSQRQRVIARNTSREPLMVLSGAPGTGKTHLISVLAADAIARGDSVLVIAGSAKAVDVLADHFANTPGPPPVTFGGSRFGERVSKELVTLSNLAAGDPKVDDALHAKAQAHDEQVTELRASLESLSTKKHFSVDSHLDRMVENEKSAAHVAGELLVERWVNALGPKEEETLKTVASNLLVNRYERRRVLSTIDPELLTTAAPLWVGSLDDVDDVCRASLACSISSFSMKHPRSIRSPPQALWSVPSERSSAVILSRLDSSRTSLASRSIKQRRSTTRRVLSFTPQPCLCSIPPQPSSLCRFWTSTFGRLRTLSSSVLGGSTTEGCTQRHVILRTRRPTTSMFRS